MSPTHDMHRLTKTARCDASADYLNISVFPRMGMGLDAVGHVVGQALVEEHAPELNREQALAIMVTMVRVSEFDKIYLDAQRQGRISFYMTSRGEEVRRHAPLELTPSVTA